MGYRKKLSVSDVRGFPVYIYVIPVLDKVRIRSQAIKEVANDKKNPYATKEGRIEVTVPKERYTETVSALTKYIESLFIKGMEKDEQENNDPGVQVPVESGPVRVENRPDELQ